MAKVVQGGWLRQSADLTELEKQPLVFELYVFPSNRTAEEAFNLISDATNAKEEFGAGGTFRRENVIISTDQGQASSLTPLAESLLNKCAGAGASQLVLRTQESTDTSTSTSGEAITPAATPEPGQEAPASEDRTNPGKSTVPGEGE